MHEYITCTYLFMTVTVTIYFMNIHQDVPCLKSVTHTYSYIFTNMGV